MINVVRSELLKIWTTKAWWLMGIGALLATGLALTINSVEAHFTFQPPDFGEPPPNVPPEEREAMQQQRAEELASAQSMATLLRMASNIYTSGQFFGVMFLMLLGAIIVTNEYFHQTATATFLATPHRTVVIVAKLIAAILLAATFWLLTTAINVVVGALFLSSEGKSNVLGEWEIQRSVLLNLAAYATWAVLGIGLGVLLRSQIAAVVTGTVLYLLGTFAARIVFLLVREFLIKEDWVLTAQVGVPAIASTVMVTVGRAFEHAPPQWVGAVVLIGYGVVFGMVGTLITRKRDIS